MYNIYVYDFLRQRYINNNIAVAADISIPPSVCRSATTDNREYITIAHAVWRGRIVIRRYQNTRTLYRSFRKRFKTQWFSSLFHASPSTPGRRTQYSKTLPVQMCIHCRPTCIFHRSVIVVPKSFFGTSQQSYCIFIGRFRQQSKPFTAATNTLIVYNATIAVVSIWNSFSRVFALSRTVTPNENRLRAVRRHLPKYPVKPMRTAFSSCDFVGTVMRTVRINDF